MNEENILWIGYAILLVVETGTGVHDSSDNLTNDNNSYFLVYYTENLQ